MLLLLSIYQRQEGDIVRVIESVGNGWLYGEDCQSGRRGQFPESFVRRELNWITPCTQKKKKYIDKDKKEFWTNLEILLKKNFCLAYFLIAWNDQSVFNLNQLWRYIHIHTIRTYIASYECENIAL